MSDAVLELFMAIYNTHANHKKCKNVISIYIFIIMQENLLKLHKALEDLHLGFAQFDY